MIVYLPLALILGFVVLHIMLRPQPAGEPFTIAHRCGAGIAPENTIRGAREAVRLTAPYAEIDIRRASDGVLVVMHDRDLSRTTGQAGSVEDFTSAEIAPLRVKNAGGVGFSDEPVPTLDAMLEFAARAPISLIVEVKDPSTAPGIEAQIVESLQRTGTQGKVIVGSFDHAWLKAFQTAAPDIPIVPIVDWYARIRVPLVTQLVDTDWRTVVLDPTFVRRERRKGHCVVVWTVDNPFLIKLMLWLGVEGITTNRPDLCQPIIRRANSA